MKKIYLSGKTDLRPRREVQVDEFSYTVVSASGESPITLPGSRTYDTVNDYLVVYANGIKLVEGTHYTRASTTTIAAVIVDMFPDGKFPKNCVLDFELYKTN